MSIKATSISKINCDGQEDTPCPYNSSKVYEYSQTISMRLARKEGWVINEFFTCPSCAGAVKDVKPVSAPVSTPSPLVQAPPRVPCRWEAPARRASVHARQSTSFRSSVSQATRQAAEVLFRPWHPLADRPGEAA